MNWRLELQLQVKQLLQEASLHQVANDLDQAVQTYQRAAALLEELGDRVLPQKIGKLGS